MKKQKILKDRKYFISLISLAIVLPLFCCGGESKQNKVKEPETPVPEPGDELNWQNVQLSKEEEEEFNKGKTGVEQVQKQTATSSEQSSSAVTGTGSGPGTLKIVLKALGQEVAGEVSVKDSATGAEVEKGNGKSTYTFSLNKGTYRIDAIFHEAIDEPKLTLQDVEIPAGGKVERTFNFPMAQVKFIPVKSGTDSVVSGYKLRLKTQGAENWFPKSVITGKDFYYISPGNYQGQLFKGAGKHEKTIDIPNIQINEGAKAQKRIDVNL